MKVEAVENRRHSCLAPMAQGALIGSVAGLVTKYTYPLNADELNSPQYKKAISDIEERKITYGPATDEFLKNIRNKEVKSPAEDVFIKMFEGIKEGDKMTRGKEKEALEAITNTQNTDHVNEFKNLCRELHNIAETYAKKDMDLVTHMMKHIRPSSFFVGGGAVIGALIALFHDIMRTDVKS